MRRDPLTYGAFRGLDAFMRASLMRLEFITAECKALLAQSILVDPQKFDTFIMLLRGLAFD